MAAIHAVLGSLRLPQFIQLMGIHQVHRLIDLIRFFQQVSVRHLCTCWLQHIIIMVPAN